MMASATAVHRAGKEVHLALHDVDDRRPEGFNPLSIAGRATIAKATLLVDGEAFCRLGLWVESDGAAVSVRSVLCDHLAIRPAEIASDAELQARVVGMFASALGTALRRRLRRAERRQLNKLRYRAGQAVAMIAQADPEAAELVREVIDARVRALSMS